VESKSQADRSPGSTSGSASEEQGFSYSSSENLEEILDRIQGSLLISTYQAGRLVAVGVNGGRLTLSLHSFDYAMGIAVAPDRIAVGSSAQIWLLQSQHDIAGRLEPPGRYDGCFVTRVSHVTGEIRVHELAWVGRELWFVNTLFSCLCVLQPALSFLPKWKPPFISASTADDRCHLNGLAVADGLPRYVTALAETDTAEGWREHKATGGCLIDVPGNATIARGFAMPHSPRVHQGRVWLLDSGRGSLVTVDPASGHTETVAELPGYPRGLAFAGSYAFIGLSRIRPTAAFADMPLAQRRDPLTCGMAIVELASGRLASLLEFRSGIHETFDVQVVPGVRSVAIAGPHTTKDASQPIWIVPEAWTPRSDSGRG
jgi:uncharacterized protein (TIGR03032 family)